MTHNTLPIFDCLPQLLDALHQRDEVVLQAPPGAGKTTQVPLSVLNAPWLQGQKIIMLEPRRVAAINAATRMAQCLGEPVGQTVGYRMRQAVKVSAKTRIEVITEGLLTRWLQDDPELTGVGLIIFDEFHERSMNTDTGLALSLQARELFREPNNPLKLLAMSATLDGNGVANLLNQAPIITSQGRNYPIAMQYCPPPQKNHGQTHSDSTSHVCRVILQALNEQTGSLLVFLPGISEINRTFQQLHHTLPSHTHCQMLHGGLALAEQQAAIAPATQGARKVVLATDIAETSLTIEGVRVVIDAGLCRSPSFDANTGLTRLGTHNHSQASSEQRAGRAGRTEPGACYRLWHESAQKQRAKFATPEILCSDLTPLCLTLLQWGCHDPTELAWLNPPPNAHWQQALGTLTKLRAISSPQQLSPLGQRLTHFACHPRLALLMVQAEHWGAAQLGTFIAAVLSEKLPQGMSCDLAVTYRAAAGLEAITAAHKPWQKRVQQLARQFNQSLQSSQPQNARKKNNRQYPDDGELIGLLLAQAFPERIAKQHSQNDQQTVFKLANGRAVTLPIASSRHHTLAREPWLAVADAGGITGKQTDSVYCACALNPKLFEGPLAYLITPKTHAQWDEKNGRFIAEHHQTLDKLIIKKTQQNTLCPTQKTAALISLIQNKGLDFLPWSQEASQFIARVNLAHATLGQPWPHLTPDALLSTLDTWLAPGLHTINTLNDFKKLNLHAQLQSLLPWPLPQELNRLAPKTIAIPSGRQAAINYISQPPVLAVKLQEMFGCEQSPSIMNGQLPLTLHLLSPGQKPLQITQDLAAFWAGSYQDVKKEMKGRYPRHPWPDNPLAMQATAKTKRKLQQEKTQKK